MFAIIRMVLNVLKPKIHTAMRKLLFALCSFFLALQLFGQTTIDGDINVNSVWTKANSPYLVTPPVTIQENITLTIEPGVVVKNQTRYNLLYVEGTLIAEGTVSEPIVFTSGSDDDFGGDSNNDGSATVPEAGDWSSIEVKETSGSTSRIEHCLFRYGGAIEGVLYAANSSPIVSNCLFQYCKYGFEVNGQVSPSLENSRFEGITMLPVTVSTGSTPLFSGNVFSGNAFNGLGLIENKYSLNGDTYTLTKRSLAGMENIPYIIEHRVDIHENTTLTVEPGVILKNEGILDLFRVFGTLISEGTENDPIVYTSISDDQYGGDSNNDENASVPEAGDWSSIEIKETSGSTSRIEHCLFRYGGAIEGVLYAANSSPIVSNCLFQYCKYGFEVNGQVSPSLENSRFEGITMLPVTVSTGSTPLFSGNVFSGNAFNGLGLIENKYSLNGDTYTLTKRSLAGMENIPYIIEHRVDIHENTTLTVEPGVILKNEGILDLFRVFGTLISEGTETDPIVYTSISDDQYGGDSNNDENASIPEAGDWSSLEIRETSGNTSRIEHCLFRYGGRLDGALYVVNSSPTVTKTRYENCETGLLISNQTGLQIHNQEFYKCGTGLLIEISSGVVEVDSSSFNRNGQACLITSGNASIHHCEFSENSQFDISNMTSNVIEARENTWDQNTISEIFAVGNPKNLTKLNDFYDDANLGIIDYSDFLLPAEGIYLVTPGSGIQRNNSSKVTIGAYPISADARILFYNETHGEWVPQSTTYLDSLHIETFFDFTDVSLGLYDVILINGADSLKMAEGFALIDAETSFGEWVRFEASNENKYSSGVMLPQGERIYCLIKKSLRPYHASTWKGSIAVTGEKGLLGMNNETRKDVALLMENVEAGYYTYNISSSINDHWEGYIKFCHDPDTLILGEWNSGEILRSHGDDWKVFELNSSVNELSLQSEGYGLNSSIEVYQDFIGNLDQRWIFRDSEFGYIINGVIQDPPVGKYYVKYNDSAVLKKGGRRSDDQTREYILFAGTNGLIDAPEQPIENVSLPIITFGQDYSTLVITGRGLTENTIVSLFNDTDTLTPAKLVYNENKGELRVDLDFGLTDTGQFVLNLQNSISDYTHPAKITIENNQWRPIGIEIIGNDKYRVGRYQTFIVKITNQSNSNIRNGYISIEFDNENVFMHVEDDLLAPEFRDTLIQLYHEHHVLKEYFFFSNLPPQKDLYLKLKIFSEDVTAQEPIRMRVKSGILLDETYADIFSLYTNTIRGILDTIPLNQTLKDSIDALTYTQWDEINDYLAEYLGLNHFNYDESHTLKKAAFSVSSTEQSNSNTDASAHDRARSWKNWWLGGTGLATTRSLERLAAASFLSGILPPGISIAFGGPKAVLSEGYDVVVSLWEYCTSAISMQDEAGENLPTIAEREMDWVFSTTPEDKFGPTGASVAVNDSISNHFVDSTALFEYRIDYWNKEDATAPAAIVYIRDTLDTDFDLSTFNFTEVGFLKWTVPLDGGDYVNVDVDTRPDMPYIVNIEGALDPATREAYWVHTTLDPSTMELTENPVGGYLPPIDSTGYQIGWVSYTIESLPNLPDSTQFTNQAFVNFDGVGKWGPAPKEGPFTNIYDFSAPVSSVLEGSALSYTDSAKISWTGSDSGSGVQDYTIYVSDGTGYSTWKIHIPDTTSWFHGERGKTYQFYSAARDRVGNEEIKDQVAEHTVLFVDTGLPESGMGGGSFGVYPNPSTGLFTLEKPAGSSSVRVHLFNATAQKIRSFEMRESKMQLDLSAEPDGIYILSTSGENGMIYRKIVKN